VRFSLPGFAIKRPITVIMAVITVIGLGVIAWHKTPLKFMPEMDFPFVFCFIPYSGATPEQVEREVAIPAEGEFRTISNLDRIRTYSNESGCEIFMRFDWGVDMGLATSEVRDRIERLKLVLPDEIDHILVQRFNSGSIPVLAFGIFREGNEEEFAHIVRTVLRPKMMRLPGVADVEVLTSKPEREILIEFDQNVLRSHNLPVYQVIAQLQAASLNISVGKLVDGETKHYVRVLGELRRPEELAELVVGPHGLRLKDVAKVGFNTREVDWHYEIDGKGGAILLLRKESEANTVATCRAILAELDRVKTDPVFEGADFFIFFDQSAMILTALGNLYTSAKYGGVMAVAVLFLFLRRVRPTLLVALAIPSSLVCAFVFMFFAGMTLNVLTMVSLIVAIGMLVDNSIVVVENIDRHRTLGHGAVESAQRGASEVGLAITASTLTTMVVFVPVAYMESGEMATYTREFAAPMVIALAASLVIALTVTPLATSRMRERKHLRIYAMAQGLTRTGAHVLGRRASAFVGNHAKNQHILNGIITTYSKMLDLAMRRRMATFTLIILLLVLTQVTAFRNVGTKEMPKLDLRQVNIDVKLDQNFDIAMADAHFDLIKTEVNKLREELGIKTVFTHYETGGGQIECYLQEVEDCPPGELPPYVTDDALNILWAKLPKNLPGVEITLMVPEQGDEGDARGITVRFRGDDAATLTQVAEQFKAVMEQIPNLSDVRLDTQRSKEEMQLAIDAPIAEQAGISPWMIARTVDVALRGSRLPYMKQGGREVPVWAQFREEDRKRRDNLDNVAVMGLAGGLVPLNQLVDYERTESPASIRRIDGKNVVNLEANVSTENYTLIQRQLKKVIASFDLPLGYSIELGDEFEQINRNVTNFVRTLIMAIILIYIVMSALFESYVLPLSIMTSVPISFVGVYWMLFLTGTSLDTIAFIGCILMVGVVVNNGIVIVDHINTLRRRGMARHEAIVQSGRDRFRPVMMTAITTILGCLPLAIGSEYGSRVTFQSLGRALIGGLTTGTLLTLFVVPLFYSLIDDARTWFLHFFANLLRLGRAKPSVAAPETDSAS